MIAAMFYTILFASIVILVFIQRACRRWVIWLLAISIGTVWGNGIYA